MITLRSDNRSLVANAKFAYAVDNNIQGVGVIKVTNLDPFQVNYPVIVGEIGKDDTEIFIVSAIDSAESTITLNGVTGYAHPESTRIVAIPFNQVRFYWTAATGTIADENPTFDTDNPLTGWQSVDPSSFYSTYDDTTNTTGFGWFKYRNSETEDESPTSNPIPYVGFSLNTVQQVFADFDSLLNTNELRLISMNERFAWLNEALSVLKNKLNLNNVEYTVSTKQTISIVAGTSEYLLPDDFSDLVEITEASGRPIGFISVAHAIKNDGVGANVTSYYLRNRYIGFTPVPTSAATYYYRYRAKASRATTLSTYIDLPDNAFYSLKDFMLYRAFSKFQNPIAANYYQYFNNAMDTYIQASVKRSANLDSWGIDPAANV